NNITRSTKDNRHGDYTVSLDNFRLPTDLTLRDFEILGFDLSYNSLNLNLRYSPLRFSVNFNTDSINERIRIRTLLNRGDITQSQHDYMMNELNSRQVALPPSLLPIFDILEEEEEENFITEYSSKQVYDIPDSSEELQYYDLESYEVD
ncbi:MAG: hypothetical protein FWE02_05050, partial [Defluviitaleaceae bacterium]|nr:hypothetical protein [Defluviitaleaceae bacterium]